MPGIINKKNKFCFSKKRGFSLLEMLIAIFIFTLIMVASSTFFARSIQTYKNVRATQRDLENAQYVMNLMAKTLRTSSIIASGSSPLYIDIYDYSQSKCIRYSFSNNAIKTNSIGAADKKDCTFSNTGFTDLSNFYVNNAYFSVTPSSKTATGAPILLGKVTISLEICPSATSCSDKARIQTSVSLRDYGTAGL